MMERAVSAKFGEGCVFSFDRIAMESEGLGIMEKRCFHGAICRWGLFSTMDSDYMASYLRAVYQSLVDCVKL